MGRRGEPHRVRQGRPAIDPLELRPDCARCFGLCCAALGFAASADFAFDKPAGQPCPNLQTDFRCGIYPELRQRGFAGCTTYDCFGAGQRVSQVTFGGRSWREDPETAERMFTVFPVMRALHELLWYVAEALTFPAARALGTDLRRASESLECLARGPAHVLLEPEVAAECQATWALLCRTSELARAAVRREPQDRHGADLIGAHLRGADLRAANVRGAYLIGADLHQADLRAADLMGTDLRGADIRGADLTGAIFLTQAQVDAAKGNAATRLSLPLTRPAHWEASAITSRAAVQQAARGQTGRSRQPSRSR